MAKLPVSPIGRVSFPAVFQQDDYGRYAVTLLFKKGETDLSALKSALADQAKEKWGDKVPKSLQGPIIDGDTKDYDGYEGMWAVKFYAKNKPAIVDRGREEITEDSDRFYAGCYARVSYTTYATHHEKGGPRVSFGLGSIQKVSDGEPFASRSDPQEDFDELPAEDIEDVADFLA